MATIELLSVPEPQFPPFLSRTGATTGPTGAVQTGPTGADSLITGPTGSLGATGADTGFTGPTGAASDFTNVDQLKEITTDLGNATGNQTLNLSLGNIFKATLTGSGTWTITNPAAVGKASTFTLFLTNGGAFVITWAVAPKWPGGMSPTFTTAGLDIITMTTLDEGTTWYASLSQDVK